MPAGAVGPIDRNAVVAAVEKYLASRGIAVSASAATASSGSCGCSHPEPAPASSVVSHVAADVVDKFLAGRGKSGYS
jgi:hypothetical protein